MGKWPAETRRKFGSPQRALGTCFPRSSSSSSGGASAPSRFTRERKGREYFSFLFHSLPAPRPLWGWSLASLPPPSCLTLCVYVFLSVCHVFCMSPAPPPILLKSCSLGTGTITLWHRISAQPLGPAGQTYFPACARPARAKWLNLQPVFLSHSIAVAQGFGQKGPRVTASLRGPPAGGRREEGEALFATDAPDPWKALRQLFSISEK